MASITFTKRAKAISPLIGLIFNPVKAFAELRRTSFNPWILILLIIIFSDYLFNFSQMPFNTNGPTISFGIGTSPNNAETTSINNSAAIVKTISRSLGLLLFWSLFAIFLVMLVGAFGKKIRFIDVWRGLIWSSVPIVIHNVLGYFWTTTSSLPFNANASVFVTLPITDSGAMSRAVAEYFLLKSVANGIHPFIFWEMFLAAVMVRNLAQINWKKMLIVMMCSLIAYFVITSIPSVAMFFWMLNSGGYVTKIE